VRFSYGEYQSIGARCILTFDGMSSHAASDPPFQKLQSSQMTRVLTKMTYPMSRKQWLASQCGDPPTHLPRFAQDTGSDFLRANRLIHHILSAFTPSSRYPGTTAHAARGFSLLPTRVLVRSKEMGHVTLALAWAKTNIFRTLSADTQMVHTRTHHLFTMALVAS